MNTQSSSQDEYEALLVAYALGEAGPETVRQVEQLLATNPEYRATLESYQAVAQALPLAAPSAEPTPDMRERLLERLNAEVEGRPLPQRPQTQQSPRPRLPFWQRLALALNAMLIVGLVGWNVNLQQQHQAEIARLQQQQQEDTARFQGTWNTMVNAMSAPGVQQYVLASESPGATGAFLFAPNQQLGCLVVRGLPQLPQNQVYQVWLEEGDTISSPGTFRVNPEGNGWLVVNNAAPINDFSTVRVTVEPTGGSDSPTSPRVIGGSIT
jgi:anti-sigma-K factor RskA